MLEAATVQSTTLATTPTTDAPPVTTQPATVAPVVPTVTPGQIGCLAVVVLMVVALSTALATALGAFRGGIFRGLTGPTRVPGRRAGIGLAVAFVAALLGSQVVAAIIAFSMTLAGQITPDAPLPPVSMLALGLMTYSAAGGIVLIVVTRFAGDEDGLRLGIGPEAMGRGIPLGFAWLLVVLPWMYAAALVMSGIRYLVGLRPDETHQLLQQIQDTSDPTVLILSLVTAVFAAPIVEELLFRGVIQTGLAALFGKWIDKEPGRGFPLHDEPAPHVEPELDYATPGLPFAAIVSEGPSAAARWSAILITSLGFALLHEAWSIPLIFLLSVMLGWLYERTGNLWLVITVHFGFNGVNTLLAMAKV